MRVDDAFDHNPKVSRQALGELHDELFGWCLHCTDHRCADAEDLMQQVYEQLLSGRARFAGRSTLKTFVFGVTSRIARSRLRRLARRLALLNVYAGEPEAALPVEDDDISRRVWSAVGELPRRQRDMVELVFRRDLTIAESAEVLGISVGSARVHYARAKEKLVHSLSDLNELAAAEATP